MLDETVPAGARSLRVEGAGRFRAGDRVVVTRPSTAAWIRTLGMDTVRGSFADQRVRWTPGSRDLTWDRVVIEVDAARGELVLDAPVTTAVEARFGGGTVAAIVRAHLATRLHRMTPRDGWLADSARTSALADARGETVLVYSVDGPSIALARALPRATYRGRWLDPRTGETTPLAGGSPRPGVEIAKPSAQDWLLLLEAR